VISQHQRADDYTALSDRMGYLLILRLAMAAVTIAWAAIRPEALGAPFSSLLAVTGAYVGIAAASEIVRRRMRHGFMAMSLALLVDGVFLAYAMYITGATQSPLRFLIYLHLVAVSLLA
jgi:two-component system cell cycle response regulator